MSRSLTETEFGLLGEAMKVSPVLDPATETLWRDLIQTPLVENMGSMNPKVYFPVFDKTLKHLRQEGQDLSLPTILLTTVVRLNEEIPRVPSRSLTADQLILIIVRGKLGDIAEKLGSPEVPLDPHKQY